MSDRPKLVVVVDDSEAYCKQMMRCLKERYGDKVQMHKSDNRFNQWRVSGNRDWRPLIRGILGDNVLRKHELLARNAFLSVPTRFWTFPGTATSLGTIAIGDKFDISMVNQWNLRLGQTGMTFVPGAVANAKVAIEINDARHGYLRFVIAGSPGKVRIAQENRLARLGAAGRKRPRI